MQQVERYNKVAFL